MDSSTKARLLIAGIYFAIMSAFLSWLTWFVYDHHASFVEWGILMAVIFAAAFALEAWNKRQPE
jgi:type II secretory pathway component PulF